MSDSPTIIYTHTDEAPALATYSLLPIIRAFTGKAGVQVDTRDISLAGRIIAAFPERLSEEQRIGDALAELGEMIHGPNANIIKLPNISASVPQLKGAIEELQQKGYDLPEYPESPSTDDERETKARYDKVKGSAVNPVLRMGNSDRRAPKAVKEYARKNPHSMGEWSQESKTHVATMGADDFRSNEKSTTVDGERSVSIELVTDGETRVLKDGIQLLDGEVFDATVMRKKALVKFLREQVAEAKEQGLLFSLHMKTTMMKVSDPIIFGHAVRVYFEDLFEKHGETLERLGFDPNNGFGDLTSELGSLSDAERAEIEAAIEAVYQDRPGLAMVDSDRGITNLHVPSDVIIDASMPAMIRIGGKMWNSEGKTQETKAVIPDSSYAAVYQEVIDFCKKNGAFDPTTMGSVPNVGLMAQKAEEYGSHDKTFEIPANGDVRVVDDSGNVLIEHSVETGDIWRMCQVKDAPIRDWVKLAVTRAKATGKPAVFWLDETRAHDRELIVKVNAYLAEDHADAGVETHIMAPREATRFSLERIKEGLDTISVTGNVLRDYLTDLFPILEVGTSAKMLSIVPLMAGGGLFETGAGGSAPKHVQQMQKEGHLRWDSLGELMALAASLDHLAEVHGSATARRLGETLDQAVAQVLLNNKAPRRKVGELDTRGSHFYLALYWAQALADCDDAELSAAFKSVAQKMADHEQTILDELGAAQGAPVDLGGYYLTDAELTAKAMRPSATLNGIIDAV